MDPALMFGMVNDQDEDEGYDMDLSGWMSRSPPEGIGNIMDDDEPMITSRPRGGGATDPNAMASAISAPAESYTYRPRSNPSNLGYNVAGGNSSPLNPLYAHDDSRIFGFAGPTSPKGVAGIKSAGLAIMAGSLIWGLAKKDLPGKVFMAGTYMYAHPVLGWNHGVLLPNKDTIPWKVVKGAAHVGALAVGVKFIYPLINRV